MDAGDEFGGIAEVIGVEFHHPPSLRFKACTPRHILSPLLLGAVIVALILKNEFLLIEQKVRPSLTTGFGIHQNMIHGETIEASLNQNDSQMRFWTRLRSVAEKLKRETQPLRSPPPEHAVRGSAEVINGALRRRVMNQKVTDCHQVREGENSPEITPGARRRSAPQASDHRHVARGHR